MRSILASLNHRCCQQRRHDKVCYISRATSDADIENILRTALMYPSFTHPSCTCAMLPLDKGGVGCECDPAYSYKASAGFCVT